MLTHLLSTFAAHKLSAMGASAAIVLGGGAAAEASGLGPSARDSLGSSVQSVTAAIEQSSDEDAQQLVENATPVAVDDEATVDEDDSVVIDVLANDSDADGDALEVLAGSLTEPAHGTAELNPDGTVTYTPDPDFHGDDGFDYTVGDGNDGEATATVAVTVEPVNDDPVAADDEGVATVDEPLSLDVLVNDSDVDGDELTVESVTDPAHGTVVIEEDGTLTYTPEAGYEGDDAFEYTVGDGNEGTDTAAVTLTVVTAGEAADLRRDECRDSGWQELGYRNQGLCVSFHGKGHEALDGPPWPLQEQWDARRAELEEKRGRGHGAPAKDDDDEVEVEALESDDEKLHASESDDEDDEDGDDEKSRGTGRDKAKGKPAHAR